MYPLGMRYESLVYQLGMRWSLVYQLGDEVVLSVSVGG